jgi:hypothetical protein
MAARSLWPVPPRPEARIDPGLRWPSALWHLKSDVGVVRFFELRDSSVSRT